MGYLELYETSHDYISGLCLLETELNQVIVSSWDGSVSLYDWEQNKLLGRLNHSCAITCIERCKGSTKCYVGSVQGELLELDWESEKFVSITEVSCMLGISGIGSFENHLVLGSWDGSFIVVDTRRNSVSVKHKLEGKVLSLDCSENKAACLTTAGIYIFNTRDIEKVPIRRESGLKFQSRCIKLMKGDIGYVQCSIDGRVAVEYFESNIGKFAFRCHRMNLKDSQFVFPVNSLCFNAVSDILYTGGSDGKVIGWNLTTKKKAEELTKLEDSVVKICCNEKVLLIATSDDSFKTASVVDNIELQRSKIYIKKLNT